MKILNIVECVGYVKKYQNLWNAFKAVFMKTWQFWLHISEKNEKQRAKHIVHKILQIKLSIKIKEI